MKYAVFLKTLSTGLAMQARNENELVHHLKRRLPAQLGALPPILVRHLLLKLPQAHTPLSKDIADALSDCPEFLLVWKHAEKHKTWPDPALDRATFKPTQKFQSLGLPELSSEEELADWLGLNELQLARFADLKELSNKTDNAFAPHYKFHIIPKPDKTFRLIEEPKPVLKRLQRRVLTCLLNKVPVSPNAYGFATGKNCIQAAARHASEDAVVAFDIKNFFTSISLSRVSGLFRSFGYPSAVSMALAGLCTVRTPYAIRSKHRLSDFNNLSVRHLPQGAPTSPALSNLCAFNLDRRLEGLANRYDARFTRYADDITYSGDTPIVKPLLRHVPSILLSEGFKPNEKKTRVRFRHQQQVSTGIVVNEKVNVSRARYDFLKSSIHHLISHRNETDFPTRVIRLSSQIAWVEQINPTKGYKLRTRFEAALK